MATGKAIDVNIKFKKCCTADLCESSTCYTFIAEVSSEDWISGNVSDVYIPWCALDADVQHYLKVKTCNWIVM